MTTARQLKAGLIYLLPVAVGSLVPLVTLPFITTALTPEQYGAWALATVYASFVTGVANLGLTAGFERNFFQHTGTAERAALLHGVVGLVAATMLVGGVVTVIWRDTIGQFMLGQSGQGALMVAAYLASTLTSIKGFYLLQFRNLDDAKSYAWFSIDETLIGALLSVSLVAGLRWGPIGLSIAQAIASSLVLTAVVWRVSRAAWPHRQAAAPLVKPLLRDALLISLPLTPRVFLGVLGTNFDKYLIGLLSNLGGVGVYTLGQRVAYVAFQVMTAIEHTFVPEVYRRMFNDGPKAGVGIGRYLTPFAYVSALIALGVGLGAEDAIAWVAPSGEYSQAVPVVCLLSVSYGIMFFGKLPQLTYTRRTAWASVLTLTSIAANISINLWTVPRWGVLGAAGGTLAAGLLTGAVGFWVRQRLYPIAWEWRPIACMFGGLLLGGLMTAILPHVVGDYWMRLAARGAIGVLFLGLGWQLGYLSLDHWRTFRKSGVTP